MKKTIHVIFLCLCFVGHAQENPPLKVPEDTTQLNELNELVYQLRSTNPDSALVLSYLAEAYAKALNYEKGVADALMRRGIAHTSLGNYYQALDFHFEAQEIYLKHQDKRRIAALNNNIGRVYNFLEELELALKYYRLSADQFQEVGDIIRQGNILNNIGYIYRLRTNYDSSLHYLFIALQKARQTDNRDGLIYPLYNIGSIYAMTGYTDSAYHYLNKALELSQLVKDQYITSLCFIELGKLHLEERNKALALINFKNAYQIASESGLRAEKSEAALMLANLHEANGNTKQALTFLKIHKHIQDSLFNKDNMRRIALLEAEYNANQEKIRLALEQEKQQLEKEKELSNVIWTRNTLIVGFIAMLIISYLLYKNYSRKHKANIQLSQLNEQIAQQKQNLELQAQDLRESNERIKTISENLELIVEKRTHTLQVQNEKLKQYLHSNSHEVRAPLARILALIHIFQKDEKDEVDTQFILDNIYRSAQELDEVIRRINDNLQKDGQRAD